MKLQIKKGSTDVTIYVFIQDSSSTTGAGLTGLAFNSAGLTCYYVRPLAAAAQLTLATLAAVTTAHSDGGFKEIDATNMPGVYRLDLSDAIVASGVNSVTLMLKGATNMAQLPIEIELVAYDPQDATSLGVSRIDAAVSSRASQTSVDTVDDFLDTEIAAILAAVDTEVAAIKAKTDNLPSDPADASDIASSFSTVNTKLDTIDDFLDTEIAAIKAKTDNLPADPADASDIASSFTTVNTKLDTIDDFLDTEVAAIKAKTDNLPASPANEDTLTTIASYIDTEVAAIKAKTDNLPSDPADASIVAGLISAVETKIDTVDTVVDAIRVTTDKLDDTLEDDAGTYRFTEHSLEEAPSGGGGGASAAAIADAVWDEKIDDHLSDRSFGAKIGIHLPFVGPDFDYKRIKKIIDEAVASQKLPEVDMEPISVALQSLFEEVRAIDIPRAEKPDFAPMMKAITSVEKAIKAIRIPETDLSPIERKIDKQGSSIQGQIDKLQVEKIAAILDSMLERIRQYFDGDMEAFKREVESMKQAFEDIPYVVMEVRDKPKSTEPKEKKKKDNPSVLEEYLKLK